MVKVNVHPILSHSIIVEVCKRIHYWVIYLFIYLFIFYDDDDDDVDDDDDDDSLVSYVPSL